MDIDVWGSSGCVAEGKLLFDGVKWKGRIRMFASFDYEVVASTVGMNGRGMSLDLIPASDLKPANDDTIPETGAGTLEYDGAHWGGSVRMYGRFDYEIEAKPISVPDRGFSLRLYSRSRQVANDAAAQS